MRALTLFILCTGIACLLGKPLPTTSGVVSPRPLTFADRVAYQYGMEEVYWRHRVWPKDNPRPKPSLDALISREQVEKKVTDYLRNSQLLADQWQQPITAGQLQAEMNRMAKRTKQPDVLRELFAALGNDPFVIAECLAKPIVAERLLVERAPPLDGKSNCEEIKNSWPSAVAIIARGAGDPSVIQADNATYRLPEILYDCADDSWTAATTENAPEGRYSHTVVWTGSEMIVWGGEGLSACTFNTGGRYDPATDSWTATGLLDAPASRSRHTVIWTGSEMIVWGGGDCSSLLNTGGRYNPVTDSWTPTNIAGAPPARNYHTAVWTGSEMIVWGGSGCGGNCTLNAGGRYNPGTDSWTATNVVNAPVARFEHRAVWTGSEMIVWGGSDRMNYLHTGARYNPTTDSWTPMSLANVPPGRIVFTAIWAGSEMIVWGGVDENFIDTNTGGRYNPVNDTWAATSLNNAPSPRTDHVAVWSASEMIVWGGWGGSLFDTGGRYDPITDSWAGTTTAAAPEARESAIAVWTGSEMIVWGGLNQTGDLNTGGMYCAQPSAPLLENVVSRKTHDFAGVYDIVLALSGTPGIECRSGGATNDYTLVVTFSANVSINGTPQAAVTSGVGGIGSNGIPNGGQVLIAGNLVTIPLTSVSNAQTIQVTLYGVNGTTNFVIPMSILIGDANGNGAVNASDVSQIKSRIGQQLNGTNFRCDVTANGFIDSVDIALLKSLVGTGLP